MVHHHDKDLRNAHPDNLVTLCGACHITWHRFERKMKPPKDKQRESFLEFDWLTDRIADRYERNRGDPMTPQESAEKLAEEYANSIAPDEPFRAVARYHYKAGFTAAKEQAKLSEVEQGVLDAIMGGYTTSNEDELLAIIQRISGGT